MSDERKYTFIAGGRIYKVPDYMRYGLEAYIEQGYMPGGFLTAVLENKFVDAVSNADLENTRNLQAYANFLYNYAPRACWGSREKVKAWSDMGGLQGLRAKR